MSADILAMHPSADLYGADSMFRRSILALSRTYSVQALIPANGPLADELRRICLTTALPSNIVLKSESSRGLAAVKAGLRLALSILTIVRLIRRSRAQVVYVSTLTMPSAILAARLARRPVVCHAHEAEFLLPRWQRKLLTLPLMLSSVTVAAGPAVSRFIRENSVGNVGKLEVVLNPVDRAKISSSELPCDRPDVLKLAIVGRVSERKGVHLAIVTTQQLLLRGIPVTLDVWGDSYPPQNGYWHRMQALAESAGVSASVNFRGVTEDVTGAYSNSHVVLVPSNGEAFGLAAAEAMASGRCVIASDVPGLNDLITPGVTGYLCERSADAFADRCGAIYSQWGEACQVARNARDMFARDDNFDERVASILGQFIANT